MSPGAAEGDSWPQGWPLQTYSLVTPCQWHLWSAFLVKQGSHRSLPLLTGPAFIQAGPANPLALLPPLPPTAPGRLAPGSLRGRGCLTHMLLPDPWLEASGFNPTAECKNFWILPHHKSQGILGAIWAVCFLLLSGLLRYNIHSVKSLFTHVLMSLDKCM